MDARQPRKVTSQFPAFRHTVARQMADYRERLAQKVDEELEKRQWGNADLAMRADVSEKTVKRILKGEHDPRRSTIRRIASGFELPVAEFSPEGEGEQLDRIEARLDGVEAVATEILARLRFQQAEQLSKETSERLEQELQRSLEAPPGRSQGGSDN